MNAPAPEPTAAELLSSADLEGFSRVPIEMVLASPTSSVIRELIGTRMRRGDYPRSTARVFQRDGRLFALVSFSPEGRPDLLYALDLWVRP